MLRIIHYGFVECVKYCCHFYLPLKEVPSRSALTKFVVNLFFMQITHLKWTES